MAETLIPLIDELLKAGTQKMVLLARHGARHDRKDFSHEYFVSLSEQGREDAYALGTKLPASAPSSSAWRFISSPIGRCVETAYQVEKGCIDTGNQTVVNVPHDSLGPKYFPSFGRMSRLYTELGAENFIRAWMEGEVPPDVAQAPDDALADLLGFLTKHLSDESPCFAATHDTTIHVARRLLGTQLEPVDYLNGVLLFERDGKLELSDGKNTAPITSPG